jgi:tRNA1(Val) A37 N6-methylase TrmN6
MFTIYDKKEWSDILQKYPKPDQTIKDEIWNKTRNFYMPLVDLSLKDAQDDFEKLESLNSEDLIKTGNVFSRYQYKWDIGNKYIDFCNVGNKSSNYFHQDLRYRCDSINSPSPYRTWNEQKFFNTLCNALWSLKVKEVTSETLRHCIAMRKYIASQFRPSAAKTIYQHFKAKNVLDFSSGWGDRLSAAMATDSIRSYVGIDPNTALKKGYESQINMFSGSKIVDIIYEPAEEALKKMDTFSPDLIFTSPPYFIAERYSKDDTQSWQRYKKIDKWLDGFLFPVIKDAFDILQTGGHLAVNISDVYCNHMINKICDPMNEFLSSFKNIEKVENINYRMAKRINSKSDKDGIHVEPIWIWKKI